MLTYLLPYDPYRIVPDFCIRYYSVKQCYCKEKAVQMYFTDYNTYFLTNGTYCRFGEAHQQTITTQVNDCFCWDYSTDSSCRFFFFLRHIAIWVAELLFLKRFITVQYRITKIIQYSHLVQGSNIHICGISRRDI